GHEQRREQEQDAPAPGEERLGRGPLAQSDEEQVGDDEADRGAQLGERAPDGAFALRGVLGGQQGRARPFAAEADALAEAQEDEAQGSQNDPARGGGGRQQADEEGADAHDEQRGDEGLLPADPVAEVAEDDRAEGAGDEGDAEDRERAEQLRRRRLVGEEERREDQRRGGRV